MWNVSLIHRPCYHVCESKLKSQFGGYSILYRACSRLPPLHCPYGWKGDTLKVTGDMKQHLYVGELGMPVQVQGVYLPASHLCDMDKKM